MARLEQVLASFRCVNEYEGHAVTVVIRRALFARAMLAESLCAADGEVEHIALKVDRAFVFRAHHFLDEIEEDEEREAYETELHEASVMPDDATNGFGTFKLVRLVADVDSLYFELVAGDQTFESGTCTIEALRKAFGDA